MPLNALWSPAPAAANSIGQTMLAAVRDARLLGTLAAIALVSEFIAHLPSLWNAVTFQVLWWIVSCLALGQVFFGNVRSPQRVVRAITMGLVALLVVLAMSSTAATHDLVRVGFLPIATLTSLIAGSFFAWAACWDDTPPKPRVNEYWLYGLMAFPIGVAIELESAAACGILHGVLLLITFREVGTQPGQSDAPPTVGA